MSDMRRVTVMIDLDWPLSHHFHIFAGIHRYARESGNWKCSTNPYADQSLNGKSLSSTTDGIIARATPELAKRARKARVPLVNVWRNSPARNVPSVLSDAEESGRMAAQHLLAHGFRRFGYLGYKGDRSARLQLSGFRKTLRTAGWGCSPCRILRSFSRNAANWLRFQAAMDEWIETWSPPVAILTISDLAGRYLIEACQQRGLNVPSDVAVLSSGNEAIVCENPEPSLSSIDLGYKAVGYEAAQLLDQLMDGAPRPDEPICVAPANVVVRRSTNAFTAEDPIVSRALRYITEHSDSPVAVDDVAAHAGVTRRTLARRFPPTLGKTVHETIATMRLERIKRELIDTKNTLETVATTCGFRDAILLSKFFQRAKGMTPGEFRKAQRDQQ